MYEPLRKIAGPLVLILTVVSGIFLGFNSLSDNPGETHKILEGMALSIVKDNSIEDWSAKETSIVTYSMLSIPIISLNKYLHLLFYLIGSGTIGAGLNLMLDRLLIARE